jgi:hypothetical protein
MPEVTLKAIEDLLDNKLDEKLDAKLAPLEHTLDSHTTSLDAIAKDVKVLLQAKIVSEYRLERIEHWAQQVGSKLGIKLEL